MNIEPIIATYLIPEPFERALKSIRETLAKADLAVTTELDVATRIRRELNIALSPCKILLVDSSLLLLEASTLDSAANVLLPLHLVVSCHGPQTYVACLNPASAEGFRLPAGADGPLAKLQSRVSRALERIAMRHGIYEPAPVHAG